MPPYTGYKVDVHPGVSHVFQSSAFRFGHTLIPPGIYRRDETCDFKKTYGGKPAWRLCAHWWDSSVSEHDTFVHTSNTYRCTVRPAFVYPVYAPRKV